MASSSTAYLSVERLYDFGDATNKENIDYSLPNDQKRIQQKQGKKHLLE